MLPPPTTPPSQFGVLFAGVADPVNAVVELQMASAVDEPTGPTVGATVFWVIETVAGTVEVQPLEVLVTASE